MPSIAASAGAGVDSSGIGDRWKEIRFAGESPFSHSALDSKTYAMAVLGTAYRESTKRNMPRRWFPDLPHTHVALDDAREQGILFLNILKDNRSPKP